MSEITTESVNVPVDRPIEVAHPSPAPAPVPVPVSVPEVTQGRSRRKAADAVAAPSDHKIDEELGREVR